MPIDLAKYPKKEGNDICCPKPMPDKPSYPEICLRDEHYDQFMEAAGNPDIDDELSIGDGVKVRVKGLRKDEYGRSVDLCVLSMDNIASEGKAKDDDEKEEETPRQRLKKKVAEESAKPTPKSQLKVTASKY